MDAAQLWQGGQYERVAARLAPAAEVLCDAAGVGRGSRVLDVGAGTGNVALAALARGAQVVASDIAPAMVEAGRARVDVEWHVAAAQDLPFELEWRFDDGVEGWVRHVETDAPPYVAAREALGPRRWGEVRTELAEGIGALGETTADGAFVVRPRYLVARAG